MRLAVLPEMVGVFAGHSYMDISEDGRIEVFDCYACVVVNGREMVHEMPFRQRYLAEQLVARIRAAGAIETDHWHEMPARPSLEERFAMYAEREAEARMGLRGEDDLYDGLV